jgi:hypothetical protein
MYGATAIYCQAVVRNLFQFSDLSCPSRNLSCCGELFVLLLCFWGDGEKLVLGDGDGDVQGAVDDFADDGEVFDGGGVAVLGPRGIGGGGIFDDRRGDGGGSNSGSGRSSGTGSTVMSLPDCSCMI